MIIKGKIERVIFKNDENGYAVLSVRNQKDNFPYVLVGNMLYITDGQTYEFQVKEKYDKKYGKQYDIISASPIFDSTKKGIVKFLSSTLFKGIGEKKALAIYDIFKEETYDILKSDPERLLEVPGISRKIVDGIITAYERGISYQKESQFLYEFGVTTSFIKKIINKYKDETIEVISQNPYILVDEVSGIGFRKADLIASEMNINDDDPFRVKAGIQYALAQNNKSGNTFVTYEKLTRICSEILNIGYNKLRSVIITPIKELIEANKIIGFDHEDERLGKCVSLSMDYMVERKLSRLLYEIESTSQRNISDIRSEIADFETKNKISLDSAQKLSVSNVFKNKISLITGGPGTGKTTIIKCIISIAKKLNINYSLCAPTGRAAKRMEQATQANASTIHRLLGFGKNNKLNLLTEDINIESTEVRKMFLFNENNKLKTELLIVDEASMCDIYIFKSLVESLNIKTRLVVIGDKDQLPAVGVGNVLKDLIESGKITTTHLTNIYRQNEGSDINKLAHMINTNQKISIEDMTGDVTFINVNQVSEAIENIRSLIKYEIPKQESVTSLDIQVLSNIKKGPTGVDNLNNDLQDYINPNKTNFRRIDANRKFYIGDKVMQMNNDYDQLYYQGDQKIGEGIFNGEIGLIEGVGRANDYALKINFDNKICKYKPEKLKNISLAYASTIHKSQGSEFPYVILVINRSGKMLLNKSILYTGVSRAKKKLYIIANLDTLNRIIKENYQIKRKTLLKNFIINSFNLLN